MFKEGIWDQSTQETFFMEFWFSSAKIKRCQEKFVIPKLATNNFYISYFTLVRDAHVLVAIWMSGIFSFPCSSFCILESRSKGVKESFLDFLIKHCYLSMVICKKGAYWLNDRQQNLKKYPEYEENLMAIIQSSPNGIISIRKNEKNFNT